jgi:hypothetical protein
MVTAGYNRLVMGDSHVRYHYFENPLRKIFFELTGDVLFLFLVNIDIISSDMIPTGGFPASREDHRRRSS